MLIENRNTEFKKNCSGEVIWRSPSNIALVKYWGKREYQLPMNPSLCFSLSSSITESRIQFHPSSSENSNIEFLLNDNRNEAFEKRIKNYFNYLLPWFSFLSKYDFIIESSNTFPHSAGIASSASAFSSIALCLLSIQENLTGIENKSFFQDASFFARLGSGSASRSVYPAYSLWGTCNGVKASSDEYAIRIDNGIQDIFQDIHDTILIVDSGKKKISSSKGHQLMNDHPFAEERYLQANNNVSSLLETLKNGNWDKFTQIIENEALSLHAMMMTSSESFILMKENTLIIINKIREAREQKGLQICFTLDAGPNIHLLYPASEKEEVIAFIRNDLLSLLENASWIDDKIGKGPQQIKNILNE